MLMLECVLDDRNFYRSTGCDVENILVEISYKILDVTSQNQCHNVIVSWCQGRDAGEEDSRKNNNCSMPSQSMICQLLRGY